jgi:metallo-beta-lactamase family protein
MKVEFIGGVRTVTGSSYIIKDDDFTIMVDCGMFQGKRNLRERNALDLIYAPNKIDALVLTHAHIDHSGLIPKLVKEGFYGNIYATTATADLCSIMLPDSAHIQEMDTKFVNKRNRKLGRDEEEPLYTSEDAENSIEHFVPVKYGEIVQIHPRIEVRFRDAGHILGSAIVEMWIDDNGKKIKLVFSGDLGPKNQALIRDPEVIDEADFLFIESTYGNRLHKSKQDTYEEFKEIIKSVKSNSGNIIIPAFAIERTQELIFTLSQMINNKEIQPIPVYIDSPLAISATEIFRRNEQCFDKETIAVLNSGNSPLDFNSLHFTRSSKESKKLNEEAQGSIIISASGMCTAGRIKYHLQNNLFKENANVLFVGYQAEGTLGRRIIEGAKQVKLYGESVKVNAKIHTLGGFSAHADQKGLLEWLGHIKSEDLNVFVVHGEEEASLEFADKVRSEYGHRVYVPHWGEIMDLNTMESEIAPYGKEDAGSEVERNFEDLNNALHNLIAQYKNAAKKKQFGDEKQLQEDLEDLKEMIVMLQDEM